MAMTLNFLTWLGKLWENVEVLEDEIIFITDKGRSIQMHHVRDCCEHVRIESIVGEIKDLIGTPILLAEESTNIDSHPEDYKGEKWDDSFTWTFYKLATIKGYVDIRWFGESNGYYSESVDFHEITK